MRNDIRALMDFVIWRPVKFFSDISPVIQIKILFIGEEWLMRIEGFYLQEPVISRVIRLDELAAKGEYLVLASFLLRCAISPVYGILPVKPAFESQNIRVLIRNYRISRSLADKISFPMIPLLSPYTFP